MALQQSKLASGLLELASGKNFPKDPLEAGKRWAHAYVEYAKVAMSPVGAPPTFAGGEQILAAALASVWASSRSAPTTAQGIAAALTAFWLTPPVVFGAGVVTSVVGTSALASALPGVWASNYPGTPEQATRKVAAAIHTFTITVITTTPGGPPVVGPIS